MKEGKINKYKVALRFNLVHTLTLFFCTAAFAFSATSHHSLLFLLCSAVTFLLTL